MQHMPRSNHIQHMSRSQHVQGVSTYSTCLDLMLCNMANMAQATKQCMCMLTEQDSQSGASAFCSICAYEAMHSCVQSSNAMKRQSQFDLAVCSNEHCHMADFKGKGKGGLLDLLAEK